MIRKNATRKSVTNKFSAGLSHLKVNTMLKVPLSSSSTEHNHDRERGVVTSTTPGCLRF